MVAAFDTSVQLCMFSVFTYIIILYCQIQFDLLLTTYSVYLQYSVSEGTWFSECIRKSDLFDVCWLLD